MYRFVRLFLSLISVIFLGTLATSAQAVDKLHFLNVPESVYQQGIVGEGTIKAGEHARVFFHFVNRTGKSVIFSLSSDRALTEHKSAIALAYEPGTAGAVAAKDYLSHDVVLSPCRIEIGVLVRPGLTVSGMCEGVALENTKYTCKMGNGPVLKRMSVVESSAFSSQINLELGIGRKSIAIATDKPHGVNGEYGTVIDISVKNTSSKTLLVRAILNPRGGGIIFPYTLNGVIKCSGFVNPFKYCPLFSMVLKPGESFKMTTIPAGGFSYPAQIVFVSV